MTRETTLHTVPVEDLIEHDTDGSACVCGASIEIFIGEAGATGKVVTHHSLDGRELLERGEDIPLEVI